jgi:hypothetical protein
MAANTCSSNVRFHLLEKCPLELAVLIYVEGVTLVLPSRLFMFNKYWRILALS